MSSATKSAGPWNWDAPIPEKVDRAAQFMPFAALTGYFDLVREQERVVECRRELAEEDAERISGGARARARP